MSPKILIVEDESLVALDLSKQLAAMGYCDVQTERRADRALEYAANHELDLALLDINIEGAVDGIELAGQLKARGNTPIVYLTAFADEETIGRAKCTEPSGYLIKPIDQRELHSAIEVALYHSQRDKERQASAAREDELRQQLAQAQKMEAIGKLTSGVAHELNNALMAVMGNINLVCTYSGISSQISKRLTIALDGCDRCANLIKQLLGFARQGKYFPETLVVSDVVLEIVEFLRPLLDKSICISILPDKELRKATFDREQLQQVLANLVVNAQQAMPDGGTLQICIGRKTLGEVSGYNPNAKPGSYLTVSVSDTGCGIDLENIDKIFDPFFSTKPRGQGTGLGLSVAYGIMQHHGGWISVDSTVKVGSKFTLYFPETSAERVAPASQPQRRRFGELGGSGTVMIIDDEPNIVEVLQGLLTSSGYKVFGFVDPLEAVAWYRKNLKQVDVAVLDMKMPKLSGEQVFEELIAANSQAKVLLFSGYAQDDAVSALLRRGAVGFFRKPLDFSALLDEIAKAVTNQSVLAH